MAVAGRSLARIETDAEPGRHVLLAAVAAADRDRADQGRPALLVDGDLPEEEFYRRARALGFRRSRR